MISVRGYTLLRHVESAYGAQVYSGVRDEDQRPVVAKFYAFGGNQRDEERFEREFRLLRDIQSEGILKALALERVAGNPVLILEAFDGMTLRQYASQHSVTNEVLLGIGIQLARTLKDVHEAGIIHRDLKPDNVLIDQYRLKVRITGFGLSVSASDVISSTYSGGIVQSTLPYISPEQTGRMTRRVDFRSDLYSLGVIIYELATGRPPFTASEPLELIHAHLAKVPDPPVGRHEALPEMVQRILMRLLEKAPEDRYQSANALLADLQRCQDSLVGGAIAEFAIGVEDSGRALKTIEGVYGRTFERGQLEQGLSEARDGRSRTVLLSGVSGIGKSTLLEYFRDGLGHEVSFAGGRFDPQAPPLSAFRTAFTSFVDQLLTESDAALASWRVRLRTGLGAAGAAVVGLVPKLQWVIGNKVTPAPDTNPDRLVEGIRRLISTVASPVAPFVLFLDDLQWADPESIRLVEAIARDSEPRGFLLIVAYRSHGFPEGGPLAQMLAAVGTLERVRSVVLTPLRSADVNRMIADALDRAPEETLPLARLVSRKTDNNPFFVRQFLQHAHELGLFSYVAEDGWRWDLGLIERAGIPDDVVGMMTDKITRLPLTAQRVMKLASVTGGTFDLPTLQAADPFPDETGEAVEQLVQEGLFVSAGVGWRFAHDRIREAAASLVPASAWPQVHLAVGRHLLRSTPRNRISERVNEIVGHLDQALALITDPRERRVLAELNLLAANQALTSGQAESAAGYFDVGLSLLDADETGSELGVALQLGAADAAVRVRRLDRAEALYLQATALDLSIASRAQIASRLVALYGLRGEPERAMEYGAEAVASLGGPRLDTRGWFDRLVEVARTLWVLIPNTQRLEVLPAATDARVLAQLQVLYEMGPAILPLGDRSTAALLMYGIRLELTRGLLAGPGVLLARVGMLYSALGRYRAAWDYGQRALRTLETETAARSARVRMVVHGLLAPWVRPWRESLLPLATAVRDATDAGDVSVAVSGTALRVGYLFSTGEHLRIVEREAVRGTEVAEQHGFADFAALLGRFARVTRHLQGDGANGAHDDAQFLAALDLEALRRSSHRMPYQAAASVAVMALCVHGSWERAIELARVVLAERVRAELILGLQSGLKVSYAVALAAHAQRSGASSSERRAVARELKGIVRSARRWAKVNPSAFGGRLAIVQAELDRLQGRPLQAMARYAGARDDVSRLGHRHLEALIVERQASLAEQLRWDFEGRAYWREARSAYRVWGAERKVAELDRAHPELLIPEVEPVPATMLARSLAQAPESGLRRDVRSLDIDTIMATSNAISEEVALDRVIERVLDSTIENVGAQRGLLLLWDGEALMVEGEGSVGGRARRLTPAISLDDSTDLLPVSIARFVWRSREPVVLGDANREGVFVADPYVRANRSRSILCAPIIKQAKLVGVIYLENALVTEAFKEERRKVLALVTAQAAISLENARLVEELRAARDQLEQRVAERTQEILSLQDDLLTAARRAGMAEVATGVLHNVGNILNSINTSSSALEDVLRRSRLPSLKRTVDLLWNQRESLATFLTDDERGRLIPQYIRALEAQLSEEQRRMQEHLQQLEQSVEHVRHVVTAQQAYAGASGMVEVVSARELVEEAVRICAATRPWREREMERDHAEGVPDLVIEKHKVLQILVNVITNARDALDEGNNLGRIVVKTSAVGDRVRITVADDGIGISRANLTRIFSHGFTTKRKGHGFGLHSSAIAAHEMGGTLAAESEGAGRGSVFTLELPVERSLPVVRQETG